MMVHKVEAAKMLIARTLRTAKAPGVLWSSGADSMVLLWLARQVNPDVPVIHWRDFSHPTKTAFADRIIEEWQLKPQSLPIVDRDAVANETMVDVAVLLQLAPDNFVYYPLRSERDYQPDEHAHCAVRILNQPTDTTDEQPGYDVVFSGHRRTDSDPVYGDVPVQAMVSQQDSITWVYPLRDWTSQDIWDVSRAYGIPQNEARYAGEQAANNDYYPLCTECFKADPQRESLRCPKTGGTVFNLGNLINLEERREFWRARFLNLVQQ